MKLATLTQVANVRPADRAGDAPSHLAPVKDRTPMASHPIVSVLLPAGAVGPAGNGRRPIVRNGSSHPPHSEFYRLRYPAGRITQSWRGSTPPGPCASKNGSVPADRAANGRVLRIVRAGGET